MDTLTIRRCGPNEPAIRAVIDVHFALMRAQSPEESCHVLPADGLIDAFMVAAEENGVVLGIGALAEIGEGQGEIKSMHTAREARGRGVARAILDAILAAARERQMTRISLETGSAAEFAAAQALYASAGFTPCPPFGTYTEDPLSLFMTRKI